MMASGAGQLEAAMKRIYMDYHATTPVDPQALQAMLPYFSDMFGNAASSGHAFGWEAKEAVESAREHVARAIGALPQEITWTSGASESTNLAIKGVAEAYRASGNHVITTAVDHKATLNSCKHLESLGFELTILGVDALGRINLDELEAALRPETILISVIHANNEIGTLQPIAEIGQLAKARGVLFHIDAAQSFCKVPIDVDGLGIDLMSLTSHKIYGPKGVGALYVRRKNPRVTLRPQLHGGGHENGLRSGTLNVPAIVGFGKAVEIALDALGTETLRVGALRDTLQTRITGALTGVIVNGHPIFRLPNNLSVSFEGVHGASLLKELKHLAVSSGSACTSANPEPSHVLSACGVSRELASATIRYGLGRFTTAEEVAEAADLTLQAIRSLRLAQGLVL
jgi:cysteine desulfurase